MPHLTCQYRDVLSDVQSGKTEKRRKNESPGRFLLGTFLFGKRKVPRAHIKIDKMKSQFWWREKRLECRKIHLKE
jgi:hypothetical protein